MTPQTLAWSLVEAKPFDEALADFTERRAGKYHTPVAEWLYAALRPLFIDQWPDDDTYSVEFDRAEIMLGLLAQDAANVRIAGADDGWRWGQSMWFGRSLWRSRYGSPVDDIRHELEVEGAFWGPLRAHLFGGSSDRADAAVEKYADAFKQHVNSRMF